MASPATVEKLQAKALTLREHIVTDLIGVGKAGHLGGSCSGAELVAALYFHKMKHDPKNPALPDRDRFLLSKGHAALVQYAALAEAGYFPKEEMKKVKTLGAMLQGHPDMTKTPGIEANTGSLGQGLSIGSGIALGLRLDGIASKVYVMVGDGELAEGQIWEAAMAAASYKLDNLVAIIDNNQIQATGPIAERMDIGPVAAKFAAFGWETIEIDGHDIPAILAALDQADQIKGKPIAIIAATVKGKCISFAEHNAAFHNGAMTAEQMEIAKSDLQKLRR